MRRYESSMFVISGYYEEKKVAKRHDRSDRHALFRN